MSTLIAQNIKAYQWNNRVLIIQTNDDSSALVSSQIEEFKGAKQELRERKMIIYIVKQNKYDVLSFTDKNSNFKCGANYFAHLMY